MKPLVDAIYSIQRDFKYKHLTDEERNHLVEELGSWLENHVKSTIQTAVSRDSGDLATCVEIMSSPDFDSAAMFPYLMRQFTKENLLPRHLLPAQLWTQTFSNLELQRVVVEIYCLAVVQYKMVDNCRVAPIQNTLNSIQQTEEVLTELRDNPQVWALLTRQYHHFRYQVGRAIAKCYADIPSGHAESTPLQFMLVTGENQERLMDALNQMEFRRLLLVRLQQLTGQNNDEINEQILSLESKEQILKKPKSIFDTANHNFAINSKEDTYLIFKEKVLNGADINQWDAARGKWGQAIHYITYYHESSLTTQRLLLLLKDSDVQYSNGTRRSRNDSWGHNILPIMHILNCCQFHLALLWIANGYEIIESPAHFYNGYWWSNGNNWQAIIQKYLVKEFNTRKESLQNAYQYYRAFESGFVTTQPSIEIDANCLLWLICVLGNTDMLESIHLDRLNVNQTIPDCNFTPTMMAIRCGQTEVVDWLLANGADKNVESVRVDPLPFPHYDRRYFGTSYDKSDWRLPASNPPNLLFMAVEYKQFNIGQKLIEQHGLIPTEEQRLAIENGLSTLIEASAANTSRAVVSEYRSAGHVLSRIETMKQNLLKTKTWLLTQQTGPLKEKMHHGMMLLSAHHQQINDVLQSMQALIIQAKPLVSIQVLPEKEMETLGNELSHLGTQLTHVVGNVIELNDTLDAGYVAPEQRSSSPIPQKPLPEEKKDFLRKACEKEMQSLGFSFEETMLLLEQIPRQSLPKTDLPAVFFMGKTGVGKSSAANECMGADYFKEEIGRKKVKFIARNTETFAVGHASQSKTLFPGFALYKNLRYLVDMPGFDDNRGKATQIMNAISIPFVLSHFSALKGIPVFCAEHDFYDEKRTPIRHTFEQIGRIMEPYTQAANPLLLVITKSRGDEDSESILEKLIAWGFELSSSPEDQCIKRALSWFTQSADNIVFLDVSDKASQENFEQKLETLPECDRNQFSFTPTSSDITLVKKVLQAILRAEQDIEQVIHDLQCSLAKQIKTALVSQSVEMPAELDQLYNELHASIQLMGDAVSDELFEFMQLLKQQKDLVYNVHVIKGQFNQLLNRINSARIIHRGDFIADELIEKHRDLVAHQGLFDRLMEIERLLSPDDGYETEEDAADELEQDSRNELSAQYSDMTINLPIWKKRDKTPGQYRFNREVHAGLNAHSLFVSLQAKGYDVRIDADTTIVQLPTTKLA